MNQNNFLQISDTMHCLRCHEDLASKDFHKHLQETCPKREEEVSMCGKVKGKNCKFLFKLGDRVRKIRGSEWQGIIVGSYSTDLTPKGWCVESELHKGSVQNYPEHALELI